MTWPAAALDELVDIRIGRTPARANRAFWGEGTPWLSIADMNKGPELRVTREQITDAAVREVGGFLVAPGTVLLSFKLSIGKVGIAAVPMFTNEAIAALPVRTPERLDAGYLAHALRALDLAAGANRAAMGKTLNKAALTELRIPLPPLDEQRRIARILDTAAGLRARRAHALSLVESMISAEFVSHFGSPVTNPRGWCVQRLGEVGLLERGVSRHRPRNAPEILGGPYPLIQTGDVARRSLSSPMRRFAFEFSERRPPSAC